MSTWALSGKTHYLCISGWILDDKAPSLECYPNFDQAFKHWDHSSRLSPISPFVGTQMPEPTQVSNGWACFFGPVFPGLLSAYQLKSLHLTLGIYNIFSFTTKKKERDLIQKIAQELNVGWEIWQVKKGQVVDVDHWQPELTLIDEAFQKRAIRRPNTAPIKDSSREYTTQVATAYLRAKHYWVEFADQLELFDEYFTTEMRAAMPVHSSGAVPEVSVFHEKYVLTNTALSQQTEQAYTGVSPIPETRGHYSMHSFLGIGVASRALQNLISFIRNAFSEAAFLSRIEKLTAKQAIGKKPLYSLPSNHDFFDRVDPLSCDFLNIKNLKADATSPCLSFFSARDGFRSTLMTISAPFEVTTSANTRSWTLQTLTHEITHILMRGVLVRWLPQPHDSEALQRGLGFLDGNPCSTIGDQLTEWMCYAVHQLDAQPVDILDEQALAEGIERNRREVDEVLTHCFDFLYFYHKDVKHYVHSVWASWDVIPNIAERVPEYVIRTASALLTLNLRKDKPYEVTLDQLAQQLKELSRDLPNSKYIKKALEQMDTERDWFIKALAKREHLVKIVRYFLYSPEVLQSVFRDDVSSGKDEGAKAHGGYPMKWLEFGRVLPQNPLRFITQYARDKDANPSRTNWLLHHLAFADE